jgi:hypothetical protein
MSAGLFVRPSPATSVRTSRSWVVSAVSLACDPPGSSTLSARRGLSLLDAYCFRHALVLTQSVTQS